MNERDINKSKKNTKSNSIRTKTKHTFLSNFTEFDSTNDSDKNKSQ